MISHYLKSRFSYGAALVRSILYLCMHARFMVILLLWCFKNYIKTGLRSLHFGQRVGVVVENKTLKQEALGSIPTSAV